jgi:S-adenosylmethionine:tRNA ribosyltransferase-isomerase
MLAGAFAGHDFLMHGYKKAIKEGYHFYSYGDAMLIV